MKKIILLLLLIVSTSLTYARKFYFSSTGNDTYTITQAQTATTPWKTLSKLQSSMSSLVAGDTILFNKGETFTGTLNITKPITISTYGIGAKPVFTNTTANYLINIQGQSGITIDGIKFYDPQQPGIGVLANIKYGITMDNAGGVSTGIPTTFVTVQNCDFSYIGIGINLIANDCTIKNCNFDNLREVYNPPAPDPNGYGSNGIVIAGSRNKFYYNTFTECWSTSYTFTYDGGAFEIYDEYATGCNDNLFMYNTLYHSLGICEMGGRPGGSANNNLFAYNKCINSGGFGIHLGTGQFAITAAGNKFYNNVLIQNDDIWPLQPETNFFWCEYNATSATTIMDIKNNIFYVRSINTTYPNIVIATTNFARYLTHTNNIYNLGRNCTLNYTKDATELLTNTALWIDTTNTIASNWNLHLISTSPAINAGVGVGIANDFDGVSVTATPEIGIYEWTSQIVPCTFTYGSWTTCTNGTQTRSYTTSPIGCSGTPPADSISRSCTNPIVISSFYYNASNKRIYIKCNVAGVMVVTNTVGSIVRNYSYVANGAWIYLSGLPRGTYYASTYGQSIMFFR